MNSERYAYLMRPDCEENLTPGEVQAGWHFCGEFDGLLRNNAEDREENPDAYQCLCFEQ